MSDPGTAGPSDSASGMPAQTPEATPADVLNDRYELAEIIGQGGMAEVRKARDTRLHRMVAVKVMRAHLAEDTSFVRRFQHEARAAGSLSHPNIVVVHDIGDDLRGGVAVPYIVMEYVQGRTLREIERAGERHTPERAAWLAVEVLRALAYSHRHGVIHRDVKPSNVMVTASGTVKVMDFGIARMTTGPVDLETTQAGVVLGTPKYLSPEQIRGHKLDPRSDIYAAGCLLYELLTGRTPFTAESPMAFAYHHVNTEPVPPSRFAPAVTPVLDAVVLRALEKDPGRRYADADTMADALLAAVDAPDRPRPALPVPRGPATEGTAARQPSAEQAAAARTLPVPTPAQPAPPQPEAGLGDSLPTRPVERPGSTPAPAAAGPVGGEPWVPSPGVTDREPARFPYDPAAALPPRRADDRAPTGRRRAHRRLLAVLVALCVVALFAVGAVTVLRSPSHRPSPPPATHDTGPGPATSPVTTAPTGRTTPRAGTVTVPGGLVGLPLVLVRGQLVSLGLHVQVTDVVRPGVALGSVIGLSPGPGSVVPAGSTVVVSVAATTGGSGGTGPVLTPL